MNDMTPMGIGHNCPPDPIDTICAEYEGYRIEAEGWADGTKIENEAQMKVADSLRKNLRDFRISLEKGQKDATAPLRDAYQRELDRWKPTIADVKRLEDCIVATLDDFKRKLAAEKAEQERIAREEATRKMREAEEAARKASAADIEAQRAAAQARAEAEDAARIAAVAAKGTKSASKGMRIVTKYEFAAPTEDNSRGGHRLALNDIAANDPDAITAFVEEYVRKNHKLRPIAGVRVWEEKEAF